MDDREAARLTQVAVEMDEYADGYAYAGQNGLRLANFLTESADFLRTLLPDAARQG